MPDDALSGMHVLSWIRNIHTAEREAVLLTATAALRDKSAFEIEYRLAKSNGGTRRVRTSAAPRFDDAGQFAGFDGTTVDTTDPQMASQLLAESDVEYQLIAESGPDLIGHYSIDGRFVDISKAYEEGLGYRSEELIGMQTFDIIHPEDKPAVREEEMLRVADGLHSRLIVLRMRHKDGHYIWITCRLCPVVDSQLSNVTGTR